MKLTVNKDILQLNGVQNYDNADKLCEEGVAAIKSSQEPELMVDLSALSSFDSALLAVLFVWKTVAAERKITMSYREVPAQLRGLITLVQMDKILTAV